jgi:hypothetical protein
VDDDLASSVPAEPDRAFFEAWERAEQSRRQLAWRVTPPRTRRRVLDLAAEALLKCDRAGRTPWNADVRADVGDVVYQAMIDLAMRPQITPPEATLAFRRADAVIARRRRGARARGAGRPRAGRPARAHAPPADDDDLDGEAEPPSARRAA